jgi:CheY-like chemotaxis protein
VIDPRHACVLIADDDPGIRRMLAVTLEKEGYQTAGARDGREALDAMRAGRTDLVLLDLKMPNVTGWEVLAERALEPELRKIPVIVITAERGEVVAHIPGDGLCALLPKPFDLRKLRALVTSNLLRAEAGAQPLPA